jgi:PAS domain-containing protein
MTERRTHLHYRTLSELLDQLPARVLLDRIPGPILGAGGDGVVAYANPAAITLLGYTNGSLAGTPLPALLHGYADTPAQECLTVLGHAGSGDIIDWLHVDGYPVRTAISTPLLLRKTDPYLMIQLTDLTELHWN